MYAQFTSCAYGVFKGAELSVASKSSSAKKTIFPKKSTGNCQTGFGLKHQNGK